MKEFKLASAADNLDIAVAVCAPDAGCPVKGIFQLVHGMCEHKERYYPFMEWLAGHGYLCIIHDHRGHGASVKKAADLGFMYDGGWRAMVEDVRLVGDWARENYGGVPFFLLGHSMGSMVVRSYVKRYGDSIDRLFVCGCPSDNPAKGIGKALAKVIGKLRGDHHRPYIIQKMSFGAYNKAFRHEGWPAAWVCSDPDTLKAYHADPLCQYVFTANGFENLLGLMQDCYGNKGWKVSNPDLPIHFISGENDPCMISPKAIGKAADHLRKQGYRNVDLKLYPGMRHEILNETDRMGVWQDILHKLQ